MDVVNGHGVQLRRDLHTGAVKMCSVLGPPDRHLPQQTYECHEMGHTNVNYGHAKDFRQLGIYDAELMHGCRMNVRRVSYNMRASFEIILGQGAPTWDDDAPDGTDLWTCVYRNHMTALKPLAAAHRRKLIHRFMASGDHPLVLESTSWEDLVSPNAEPTPQVSSRPLLNCVRCKELRGNQHGRVVGRALECPVRDPSRSEPAGGPPVGMDEEVCRCAAFMPWPAEDLQGDNDGNQDLLELCHACEKPRYSVQRSDWWQVSSTSHKAFAQGLAGARRVAKCQPEPPVATLVTPLGYVSLAGEAVGPDGALHALRARADQSVTIVFYEDGVGTSADLLGLLQATWPQIVAAAPPDTDPLVGVPLTSQGPLVPVPWPTLPVGDPVGAQWALALGLDATPAVVTIDFAAGTWWHTSVPRSACVLSPPSIPVAETLV
jgi:hypothetical protein